VVDYMGYTFRDVGTQRVVMFLTDGTSEEIASAAPVEGQPTELGVGSTFRVLTYAPGPCPDAAVPPA
jgi:hypothetical protein